MRPGITSSGSGESQQFGTNKTALIEWCWFLTKFLVTCRVLAKMAAPIWTVAAATNWP